MTVTVQPTTPDFAAEVGDVDLGKPLSPEDLAAIRAAFTRYAVLVFPDQHFTDESHLDFARHFGPLETSVFAIRKDIKLRLQPQLADVGNLDSDNRILKTDDRVRLYQLGNRLWHTDSSFKRLPAYCSILHGRSIPPIGGQTEFADMRAAYDALPETTKQRIAGLVAEHSLMTSRAKLGFSDFNEDDARPSSRCRRCWCAASRIGPHEPLYRQPRRRDPRHGPARGREALKELIAHATQRQFVYYAPLARERPRDVGRPLHHASRPAFDDQRYSATCAAPRCRTWLRPASRWAWPSPPNDAGAFAKIALSPRRRRRGSAWRPRRLPRRRQGLRHPGLSRQGLGHGESSPPSSSTCWSRPSPRCSQPIKGTLGLRGRHVGPPRRKSTPAPYAVRSPWRGGM
jgi:alpha-ketoglutarate-dependent 2,4-dichlorophenoxyacetate dioxygenase